MRVAAESLYVHSAVLFSHVVTKEIIYVHLLQDKTCAYVPEVAASSHSLMAQNHMLKSAKGQIVQYTTRQKPMSC